MFRDWLRALFSPSRRGAERSRDMASLTQPGGRQAVSAPDRRFPPPRGAGSVELVKRSHGLAQFVASIRDNSGLSILDLGEISQSNVTFITNLGHRLYSVDFLRTLDSVSTGDDPPGGPSQRNRMEAFLEQCLGFDAESLDGTLGWGTLQFLSRPLLLATVDRLHQVLRPGACLLALFQTNERAARIPVYSYRIAGDDTLRLNFRGERQPVQIFNNRDIERLFERFDSVKFFLTRDNLREVIVRR